MDTLAILRHNGETKLGHQIAESGVQVSLRGARGTKLRRLGFLPVRCGRRHHWTGRFSLYSKSRKMGQFCGLKRRSDAHLMKESLDQKAHRAHATNDWRKRNAGLQFNVLHQIRAPHAERAAAKTDSWSVVSNDVQFYASIITISVLFASCTLPASWDLIFYRYLSHCTRQLFKCCL